MDRLARVPIDPPHRGLVSTVGIKSPQSSPDSIDMRAIVPIVDYHGAGYSQVHEKGRYLENQRAVSLAGIAGIVASWVDYQTPLDPNDLTYDIDHNFFPVGFFFHVNFDAAGIAAFQPNDFWVMIRLVTQTGGWVQRYAANFNTNPGCLIYFPGWGGSAGMAGAPCDIMIPIVPRGCEVSIAINCQTPAVNFPANTEITYRCFGMQVPIGSYVHPFM